MVYFGWIAFAALAGFLGGGLFACSILYRYEKNIAEKRVTVIKGVVYKLVPVQNETAK